MKTKLDFIPACLESLGLMQRTYDGSFDIRISMSFARLALNWVAAWRGRHKDTENRWGLVRKGWRDEGQRTGVEAGRWAKVETKEEKMEARGQRWWPKKSYASRGLDDVTGSPVETEHWAQCGQLGLLTCQPVTVPCSSAYVRRAYKCQGISQLVGGCRESPSDRPLNTAEGKHNTDCFTMGKHVGMYESVICKSVDDMQRKTLGDKEGWHTNNKPSHRFWAFLVTQLLPVETLGQDLILWHTHNLQTRTGIANQLRL